MRVAIVDEHGTAQRAVEVVTRARRIKDMPGEPGFQANGFTLNQRHLHDHFGPPAPCPAFKGKLSESLQAESKFLLCSGGGSASLALLVVIQCCELSSQ
jgi:hypothetical protein